jgi:hypothetical protein
MHILPLCISFWFVVLYIYIIIYWELQLYAQNMEH